MRPKILVRERWADDEIRLRIILDLRSIINADMF